LCAKENDVLASSPFHKESEKRIYDLRITENDFGLGDLIYLLNTTRLKGNCPKLQNVWLGPYLVVRRFRPVLYEIQNQKNCAL